MKNQKITRRKAIVTTSLGAAGVLSGLSFLTFTPKTSNKLAILGGEKVRKSGWGNWPIWDESAESEVLKMLRSGRWYRGRGEYVEDFEKEYVKLIGTKRCLATASGTTALLIAHHVLGVDAGDEVIVSPFTFIATYNSVFISKALPVFADTDPETMLIDPKSIPNKITERTSAILPVHICGMPAPIDEINTIAKNNQLKVIEEALNSKGYKRLFSEKRLNQWGEENILPGNDLLAEQAVFMKQNMLLGNKADMDDIASAMAKIYENRNLLI